VGASSFKTELGARLQEIAQQKGYSIEKITEQTDVGYEQIRRILRGLAIPSKPVLRQICEFLKLNFDEFNRIRSRDEIRKKHGVGMLRDFNPENDLAKLEAAWPTLRGEQKRLLLGMLESFLKENSNTLSRFS
jgi:transcriptional regulator with XRE-family HTH domain